MQGSAPERGKRLRRLREAAQELSRYLISLRVPLGLLAVALVAFLTQQLNDVLLAMALEPEWGEFGLAAVTAALFGTVLWFSARSLSNALWMRTGSGPAKTQQARPPARPPLPSPPVSEGVKPEEVQPEGVQPDELKPQELKPEELKPEELCASEEASSPAVTSLPAWIVWWLPRLMGMAPALLMALVLLQRVGLIGVGPWMALLLSLEAAGLLWLFYARTRIRCWLRAKRQKRLPLADALLLRLIPPSLTVRSGERDGLFSPRTELALMALAWMVLTLISVPIARAAYGPLAGGSRHLYGILIGGAAMLALDYWAEERRVAERQKQPSVPLPHSGPYWRSFALLLLLALLLPLLINASGISAVAIPRYLGSIAILYLSLAIFTVFASSFFLFGSKTGVPLLSLLLIGALLLASFRVNDNHAVRLLAGAGMRELPEFQQTFQDWLNRDGRRQAIEASGSGRSTGKWPIYVASAQGGGVYAAYHAAKALAVLSQAVPAFPDHLFAISGVSGGSVGSTLYVNALSQARSGQDLVDRIDQTFDRDQLSPVLAAMLFPDTAQRFYPVPVPAWDRALGLELSFSDGGAAGGAPVSLESSFYREQQGPFLVLNTTEVESGRRLLLSPFRFESDATFHGPDHQDVRFSTAAVMSARFPLITPYAFFNGSDPQRQRRSVDGGYYDNSGAVTAQEIVQALNAAIEQQGLSDKVEVIPIAIVGIGNYQSASPSDRAEQAETAGTRTRTRTLAGAGAGAGQSTTDPNSAVPQDSAPATARGPKPLLSLSAVDALFAARDARVAKALADYNVRCGERMVKEKQQPGLCITLQTKYVLKPSHTATVDQQRIPTSQRPSRADAPQAERAAPGQQPQLPVGRQPMTSWQQQPASSPAQRRRAGTSDRSAAREVREIPLGWTLSCQARAFLSSQLAVDDQSPLPCLSRQHAQLQLEPAGPVAGKVPGVPSFATLVQRVRQQVEHPAASAPGSPPA